MHRPGHVLTQRVAEFIIFRQMRILRSLHKAGNKTRAEVVASARAGVDFEHRRMAAAQPRVARRTTEDLRPIPREPRYMVRVAGVREGVVQDRVLETAQVMCCGKCEEGRLAPGELENGGAIHRAQCRTADGPSEVMT